jgi:hypothetical protein
VVAPDISHLSLMQLEVFAMAKDPIPPRRVRAKRKHLPATHWRLRIGFKDAPGKQRWRTADSGGVSVARPPVRGFAIERRSAIETPSNTTFSQSSARAGSIPSRLRNWQRWSGT